MKKFLLNISLFAILSGSILSYVLINYGGFIDYFYEKFTVPKAPSLIMGDSRSLQGLQPSIINQNLGSDFEVPMLNYAFTIQQVCYGKPYNESIKRIIKKDTKKGLFILGVNPWVFTAREGDDLVNDVYSERNLPPHNMRLLGVNPNFEYFFKNFPFMHFRTIIRKTAFLHKDGWLEERNPPKDQIMIKEWKKNQQEIWSNFAKKSKKSNIRLRDFEELVTFLKGHGTVVLLKTPVDKTILDIENKFDKNFDETMTKIAVRNNTVFLNYSLINNFSTNDGVHLDNEGGAKFTKILCDSIKVLSR